MQSHYKPLQVRNSRRVNWGRLLLWIALGVGSILVVAPFYWSIITSFKTQAEITAFPPTWFPAEFTLENWIDLGDLSVGSFPAASAISGRRSAVSQYSFATAFLCPLPSRYLSCSQARLPGMSLQNLNFAVGTRSFILFWQ